MNVEKLGLTLQLLVSLTIFGQTVQFQRYLQSIFAREVNYFDRELFENKQWKWASVFAYVEQSIKLQLRWLPRVITNIVLIERELENET